MNLFLILVISFSLHAKESSKIWGKIIKSDKTVKNLTYKYFMTYESDGKFHAYPLDTKDKVMAGQISNNVSQFVRLSGEFKITKIITDGSSREIPVFVPDEIKPLSLSELSAGSQFAVTGPDVALKKERPAYNGGGIEINDQLANTLIITGGSLMIGSAILKSLKKK